MEEKWKDISGYENYMVSNLGNIYSKNIKRNLKLVIGTHGYFVVNLSKDGKQRPLLVHVLVANSFCLVSGAKQCVNHIDGNKLNNNYNNLEFTTYSENSKHAYDIGLSKSKKNKGIKYTEEEIRNICKLLEKNRVCDIVKTTNYNENFLRSLKAKKIWPGITSEYKFLEVVDSGENRYNSKLTNSQVEEIIRLYSKGNLPSTELGRLFNVSKVTILNIINGKSYKRKEHGVIT